MSVDKLWNIYHDIRGVLTAKISEQKRDLDSRLESLGSDYVRKSFSTTDKAERKAPQKEVVAKRSYPKVLPLYRNPAEPSETWSGRGNRPRWLAAQIAAGKDQDDFRIKPLSSKAPAKTGGARKKKARRS
jgi:DNA-binding protein H-NS